MNVLLVQDDCSIGGHTFLRLENARGLIQRGHSVLCFFSHDHGYLKRFAAQCPTALGDPAALVALLRCQNYDVVHGDASMLDLPGILKSAGFRGRLVLTRHAVDSPVGWTAATCQAYVAESGSSAALMQPYTDLLVERVPNGIDTDFFRPVPCEPPPKPIIAWCGRSGAAFKNLPQYLRVTGLMDPDAYELRVADGDDGDGSRRGVYQEDAAHIASWRCYAREEFPLFFSEIAASGGCLLCTSHSEGLPLTLLEAMACGCPVVAQDARGVNDVLTGGLREWLFPPTAADVDVADFVRRSLPCLRQAGTREQLRKHITDNFSVAAMVEGNLRVYRPSAAEASHHDQRAQIASNLWRAARERVEEGGRARDALFAMRAAIRLQPLSVRGRGRLTLLLRCAQQARLNGARPHAVRSRAAFSRGAYREGMRQAIRALRLHPGALLTCR